MKRALCWLLTIAMCLSLLSFGVFAAEEDGGGGIAAPAAEPAVPQIPAAPAAEPTATPAGDPAPPADAPAAPVGDPEAPADAPEPPVGEPGEKPADAPEPPAGEPADAEETDDQDAPPPPVPGQGDAEESEAPAEPAGENEAPEKPVDPKVTAADLEQDADGLWFYRAPAGPAQYAELDADGAIVTDDDGYVSLLPPGMKPATAAADDAPVEDPPAAPVGEPGGATTEPGGATTEPGGATKEPGGATTEPGGATKEPGGATTEPGGATTEPGGATTEPGDSQGGASGDPGGNKKASGNPGGNKKASGNAGGASGEEIKTTTVKLANGEVTIYDFTNAQLYAYSADDEAAGVAYAVASGEALVGVTMPALADSVTEWSDYLDTLKLDMNSIYINRAIDAAAVDGLTVYAPETLADELAGSDPFGSLKAVYDALSLAFPDDGEPASVDKVIAFDASGEMVKQEIDKLEFRFLRSGASDEQAGDEDEAVDVVIPAVRAILTDMYGKDTFAPYASSREMEDAIEALQAYKRGGASGEPGQKDREGLADVDLYIILPATGSPIPVSEIDDVVKDIRQMESILTASASVEDYIEAMRAAFPDYKGELYLEQSAELLFPAAERNG